MNSGRSPLSSARSPSDGERTSRIGRELQVLAESEVFLEKVFYRPKDFDPNLKRALKQASLDTGKDSEGVSVLEKSAHSVSWRRRMEIA